ncbi:MAG: hypothetical protein GTO18_09510 [Anaerolineales bacterium]|nr:hypothetical protein [Anaerolineales bacterium]
MSQLSELFKRPEGDGWLVLADKLPALQGEFANLADKLITHCDLSYLPICISAEEKPSLTDLVHDLQSLLDLELQWITLDEAASIDAFDPGLVILTGGKSTTWVDGLITSDIGRGLLQSLQDGALVFVSDSAAAALGTWVVDQPEDEPFQGLGWLQGAIISHRLEDPAESPIILDLLSRSEPLFALGLAGGRIFALGPGEEVELWGIGSPTLVLGRGWQLQADF